MSGPYQKSIMFDLHTTDSLVSELYIRNRFSLLVSFSQASMYTLDSCQHEACMIHEVFFRMADPGFSGSW